MKPKILFEDLNMLVVDKPAGMIVNKADTAKNLVTLQDWIERQSKVDKTTLSTQEKEKYTIDGYNKYDEFINRSGIVHRLDKETSGIVLVAKNVETFIKLQNQFKDGTVKKTYIALVHGNLENEEGEVDAPIGRLPWNRMRFGIIPEGREARTLYKVLERRHDDEEEFSLVEVYPQTGRTHQIRVHFQHIKHSIVGDELYAGRKQGKKDRKKLPRHFLHATRIKLIDPTTNQPQEYSSGLPPELNSYLQSLSMVD